jgi:hypothetical protein
MPRSHSRAIRSASRQAFWRSSYRCKRPATNATCQPRKSPSWSAGRPGATAGKNNATPQAAAAAMTVDEVISAHHSTVARGDINFFNRNDQAGVPDSAPHPPA